jgi:arylsulfatase A-like enzyme
VLALLAATGFAAAAEKARPNLIVVVTDGLRADRATPAAMPFLSSVGNMGVVFRRAYAPAPARTPSLTSLLTSRLPSRHGVLHDAARLAASERTVAELLRREGYATATVLGPGLGLPDGLRRGFDYVRTAVPPAGGASAVSDVNTLAFQWLDVTAHRPLFLVVQYGEPDVPYAPSTATLERLPPDRRRSLLDFGLISWRMSLAGTLPPDPTMRHAIEAAYDAEVATLDDALRALVDGLRARGVLRDVLFVVTADHGTELGEHGGFGHGGSLHDEVIHVPLFIARSPALSRHAVSETVSLLDVAPTLLDVGGLAAPSTLEGRSLRPLLEKAGEPAPARGVVSELAGGEREGTGLRRPHRRAVIDGPMKLIETCDGNSALYDLAADPRETTPLPETAPGGPPLRAALGRLDRSQAKSARRPAACVVPSGPPSILLVVFDTTRSDAVSCYGAVEGTTPYTDALAAGGLRYTHAYSNSNWTLPSHVSLFTGLPPSVHGVRCGTHGLSRRVATLAELLHQRGYETFGASENPWITGANGTARGFERFRRLHGVERTVANWLDARRGSRPAFIFLNFMDAHDYAVREDNPFLPRELSTDQVRERITDVAGAAGELCVCRTGDPGLALLRKVYLGGVRAADAKLGQVLLQLAHARVTERLVTIVTADHGEFFGERGLTRHDTGLGEGVLHVPLVVHGLDGVAPAVVDAPVELADVFTSILAWTDTPHPRRETGRPLPTSPGTSDGSRAVVAEYTDGASCYEHPAAQKLIANRRKACGPQDRIDGNGRAVIRPPHELLVFDRHPDALFDVARDPAEEHDRAAADPETVAALRAVLDARAGIPAGPPAPRIELDVQTRERLRALGYVGGPE